MLEAIESCGEARRGSNQICVEKETIEAQLYILRIYIQSLRSSGAGWI
jgi:hypothetical protein